MTHDHFDPRPGPEPTLSRRELLAVLGGGALALSLPSCGPVRRARSSEDALADPLYLSSARALEQGIRRGAVSSEEVVRACLDRIEEVNGDLNAVVQLAPERALEEALRADRAGGPRGPLHGVPMTIKDSLDTAGMVTTGGTLGRRSHVPERDATVVARLRRAGAILLGKTNTSELTLSVETDNLVYGRTRNPWDLSRTSGGSSGGSAAIVAAGGVPFDVGTDYGGSIRIPGHYCGVAGLKPGAGLVPRTGNILPFGGLQDPFQQVGPLARTTADLALLLPIMAGPDGVDPSILPLPWRDPDDVDPSTLRVAFHSHNGIARATPDTVRVVETVVGELAGVVAVVDEVSPPGLERSWDLGRALARWDGGARIRRLLAEAGTVEHTVGGIDGQGALAPADLDRLLADWYEFRSRMHGFLTDHDAIVCPVATAPAPPHGGTADELEGFSYATAYNYLGWPAATVPGGSSAEGMPIGVQVAAGPGREDVVLALARAVEEITGGYSPPKRPETRRPTSTA